MPPYWFSSVVFSPSPLLSSFESLPSSGLISSGTLVTVIVSDAPSTILPVLDCLIIVPTGYSVEITVSIFNLRLYFSANSVTSSIDHPSVTKSGY